MSSVGNAKLGVRWWFVLSAVVGRKEISQETEYWKTYPASSSLRLQESTKPLLKTVTKLLQMLKSPRFVYQLMI